MIITVPILLVSLFLFFISIGINNLQSVLGLLLSVIFGVLTFFAPNIFGKEVKQEQVVHIIENVPIVLPAEEVQHLFRIPLKDGDILVTSKIVTFGWPTIIVSREIKVAENVTNN